MARGFVVMALLFALGFSTGSEAAKSRGVTLQLRASEANDAAVEVLSKIKTECLEQSGAACESMPTVNRSTRLKGGRATVSRGLSGVTGRLFE